MTRRNVQKQGWVFPLFSPDLRSWNKTCKNYFFLENYLKFTSEGAVSHNVLYYQPLPITRNQVGFYANNYFE